MFRLTMIDLSFRVKRGKRQAVARRQNLSTMCEAKAFELSRGGYAICAATDA
jgi:hypothetical protein